MILNKKKYGYLDMIIFPFKMAPGLSSSHFFIKIFGAASPALRTVAIAIFINNIINIQVNSANIISLLGPLIALILLIIFDITAPLLFGLMENKLKILCKEKICPEMIVKYASLEYKNIENAKIQDLLNRVCPDIDGKIYGMYATLLEILSTIITITGVVLLLFNQIWWIGVIYLVFSVPIIILAQRFSKRNYDAERKMSETHRRTQYLSGILLNREAAMERQLFGFTQKTNESFLKRYETAFKYIMNIITKNIVKMKSINVIITILSIVVIFFLAYYTVEGDTTIGVFIGLTGHIVSVNTILSWGFGDLFEKLFMNREYLTELSAFMELTEEESINVSPLQNLTFNEIEFKDVSFKYPGSDNYILKNLSFKIENGKHYSLVGANGSGKTTIIKLLTNLYTDYEGEILVDGVPIRQCSPDYIRGLASVIHQDFAKYSISIRENILLGAVGREGDFADEIDRAVEVTGLTETIQKMPSGLDTLLGSSFENGVDISIGEWQKVAIARNILSKNPLKILDEPTSALDPISESFVYHKYGEIFNETTTVMISHRLGSTKLADIIYVLADGRIIESGSHMQLMLQNGVYAGMYEAQSKWYSDWGC